MTNVIHNAIIQLNVIHNYNVNNQISFQAIPIT